MRTLVVIQEELKKLFAGATFTQYTPVALMPWLNKYGEEGWELVLIEPVSVGGKGDILLWQPLGMAHGGYSNYTHTCLCTFKRPKNG
jgi:hypothetical protein